MFCFSENTLSKISQCATLFKDFVEIRDENQKVLARYCGLVPPPIATTAVTSQVLFVYFVSDSEINAKGFVAEFSQIWGSSITGNNFEMSNYCSKNVSLIAVFEKLHKSCIKLKYCFFRVLSFVAQNQSRSKWVMFRKTATRTFRTRLFLSRKTEGSKEEFP